jgi:hypothetical protein
MACNLMANSTDVHSIKDIWEPTNNNFAWFVVGLYYILLVFTVTVSLIWQRMIPYFDWGSYFGAQSDIMLNTIV